MSNETKWTPGPWVARGSIVLIGEYGTVEEDGSPAAGGFDIYASCWNKNPLRAAMIVFLMMQEAK